MMEKLTPPTGSGSDFFGNSVSVHGNYVIIGAPSNDDKGAAYIFSRVGNDWNFMQKLTASDGTDGDDFGISVSISSINWIYYVIVGAWKDGTIGTNSGSAYIFKLSNLVWEEVAKLQPGDLSTGDGFGVCVSMSGEYAIVGSYHDDSPGSNSGSAYIFHLNSGFWPEEAKLVAVDGYAGDEFGFNVSIENKDAGALAIIGSVLDDDMGNESGSAYIFSKAGGVWSQDAKLTASDGTAEDWFGVSVAIDSNHVIVGAARDDDFGIYTGSAYIYHKNGNTWSEIIKLGQSDPYPGSFFGWSVDILGDQAVVGALFDDDNGPNSGSVYVYKNDNNLWAQETKLIASDGINNDNFGNSVSLTENSVFIGAWRDNGNYGSVYCYVKETGIGLNDALMKDMTIYFIGSELIVRGIGGVKYRNSKLQYIDCSGKVLLEEIIATDQDEIRFNTGGMKKGIYFIIIRNSKEIQGFQKFII